MNILVDLRALQSGNISGVEVFIINIIRGLCEQFPEDKFYLWTNSHKSLPENFPEFDFPNAFRIHTSWPNILIALLAAFFRRPYLDMLVRKKSVQGGLLEKSDFFHIFFVPDPRPSPVSKRCKKVIVVHDLSPLHFPRNFSIKTRLWYCLLSIATEIHESSWVLTPSRFTKNDIQEQFSPSQDSIAVIGAGVPEFLHPITDSIELANINKKYNLPDQFLLTLSTLEPRKNIHNLIEAFSRFQSKYNEKNFPLVIAGKGNPKIFRHISLPKKPFIIFPGFIEEDEKAALLSSATGFIYPSLFEGFGIPVLEAMACGTPVACSQTTSLPEVYGDAAITFDPEKISEITEAIETLFFRRNVRLELSKKALQRASAPQFLWSTVARKSMAIFRECVTKEKL